MTTLVIKNLQVSVNADGGMREILRGVDLTINSGETHAIMGPNGSGKSTLAYSIAGHPKYTITGGEVTLDGIDVLEMSVDERARAGLFLAMQYPVEVPGVSVSNFLRTAATAMRGEAPKVRTWIGEVKDAMSALVWIQHFPSAALMKVSLAEKRNAMRSCNLNCLNQKLRSWMKLTQD